MTDKQESIGIAAALFLLPIIFSIIIDIKATEKVYIWMQVVGSLATIAGLIAGNITKQNLFSYLGFVINIVLVVFSFKATSL